MIAERGKRCFGLTATIKLKVETEVAFDIFLYPKHTLGKVSL